MKIELKSIKTSEIASEETNFFRADIWIDGKKRGYAENDGRGGCTFYNWHVGCRDFIEQAENYCKTLPPRECDLGDGRTFTIESNLENFIDDLVEKHLEAKAQKKLEKKMEKGLLISKNPKVSYSIISWKNRTIEDMLRDTLMTDILKITIQRYRNQGYTIMNTNIPTEILNYSWLDKDITNRTTEITRNKQLTYEELAMYMNAD